MTMHRVCRLDDLSDGQPTRRVVDGRGILLTTINGEPHAIDDACPHNAAQLSDGIIRDGCVTCPSHLWRFSLTDGSKQGSPDVRVAVYATRITADLWVEVDVPESRPTRSLREILLAHARGEDVNAIT